MSAADEPDIPPAVDPGTPTYTGPEDPVPDEPVPYDPTTSMLAAIHDTDVAAGGDAFWFDRVLERPAGRDGGNHLYSRGRALYMYTHDPAVLGFAGGYAYRERPTGGNQTLYSIALPDVSLSEVTDLRRQHPSHWSSVHAGGGLRVVQHKFITHNNVAVTVLTLENTGDAAVTRDLVLSSQRVDTPVGDAELTGTVQARYDVTTMRPRLSGEGFVVSGPDSLTRTVTLDPGASVTVKAQMGVTTEELPESTAEYERFRDAPPREALRMHVAEYNRWWVDNVPYIDAPDQHIKKMSYYRTFLSRFNHVDANIPGNDYQFPVSIEGVLGYNNAIQLTQPMHMQDLKYLRDPIWSYGNWLSSGESSKCDAFIDNPGSFSWGNTYEQYIAREAWNAYKVHGGDRPIVGNFAHYAECDVKGQLAKYDSDGNHLIEYTVGFLTGNDADAVPFRWAPGRQDRAETAFWYSGAKAAAEAYEVLGDDAKAAEMEEIADNISTSILDILWDDTPADVDPPSPAPATRSQSQEGFGNAITLNGAEPNRYVEMPEGIVSDLEDITIATWVNRATTDGQTWSRVFDFGTGTTSNMFLTVNAGGAGMRFAITTSGGGGEQRLTAPEQLPTGWQHVAVTLSGTTGTLYLNGEPVATNDNMTLDPASLGTTTNNWIGRSQYADPALNAAVDEFQIHDRALDRAEIQSLLTSPAGEAGGGNVAWYRFDEAGGNAAPDASGNGRDATVSTPLVGPRPGKVFKHRHVATDALIPWKDQQNFAPFIEGIPPNTDEYTQALRYYADAEEFPIMPFYTANQRDQAEAGSGGTNNFSNINSTLQAQVFSSAIREYPSEHITPGMYRRLLEWLTWVQYVDGDHRFPNNNEFFFNWDPETRTFGRSGIHHNILGAYNFMLIDDIAGLRPRLDDVVELWPIDVGWDYFTVNNLRYHDRDLTLVWDRPDGEVRYPGVPEGYSVYVDGRRVLTVDRLAHVTWSSRTGRVKVLDDSRARVRFARRAPLAEATEISLAGNDRIVDMFQRAGRDLSGETGRAVNHAEGRPVTASFTTTDPPLRATAPEFAIDGFTISGLPADGPAGQAQPGYLAPNTIWGTEGSPNVTDWFEVDLQAPRTIDTVKLYFFSDKRYDTQQNCPGDCSDRYREPASYTVQVHNGDEWVDVADPSATPAAPTANYNVVTFAPTTAQRLRVVLTPKQRPDGSTYGIGLKELQVYRTAEVTVADLRRLVRDGRADGEVTGAGEVRLLATLRVAEALLDHGPDSEIVRAAARRVLERFVDLAQDPDNVPGERTRQALVDAAEHLLAALRGPGRLG